MINRGTIVRSLPLMVFAVSPRTSNAEHFYDMVMARNRESSPAGAHDLGAAAKSKASLDTSWTRGQSYEMVSIRSEDGLALVAYYLPASGASKKVAILARGYAGNGLEMSEFVRFYREELGYNVLVGDAVRYSARN